jgi:hypothetical protein
MLVRTNYKIKECPESGILGELSGQFQTLLEFTCKRFFGKRVFYFLEANTTK